LTATVYYLFQQMSVAKPLLADQLAQPAGIEKQPT
jgi:hypothetical protein